jgi:small subunit ribosomal protein S6
MLYEIVGIVRCAGVNGMTDTQAIIKLIGKQIVNNRGVIRSIENWGLRPLPQIMNKNRRSNVVGSHFFLKFDSSPAVQNEINRVLQQDPRMIRAIVVKSTDSPKLKHLTVA